jgi:hypothetical protein
MPYANHPHSAFLERGWFAYSGSRPRQGKKTRTFKRSIEMREWVITGVNSFHEREWRRQGAAATVCQVGESVSKGQ